MKKTITKGVVAATLLGLALIGLTTLPAAADDTESIKGRGKLIERGRGC